MSIEPRPYPAWWIAKAAQRKAQLDAAVARLAERAYALPTVRDVIVFGSYARDQVGPNSDLDVIVVSENDASPFERVRAFRAAVDLDVRWDLFVYTPRELDEMRRRPFIAQALREGRRLDARTSG